MVLSWKNLPIKNYRGEGFLAKNAVFADFSWPPRKNFQLAAIRTILILEPLPMAHMKAYVPNFPKHPWESRKSLKLRELCPSKVRWSRFVSLKNAVFSALFWRKSFFWPTSTKATPPMIGIFGKLCISAFCTYPNIRVFLNRQAVRILLTPGDRSETLYWDCVIHCVMTCHLQAAMLGFSTHLHVLWGLLCWDLICYYAWQKCHILSNLHAKLQIAWEYSSRFPHFREVWLLPPKSA